MRRGRRIAFDYGDVRIGVAVSDADSILCSPLCNLNATDKHLSTKITHLLSEIDPVAIYVGRPTLLSGRDGNSTEKALSFVELVKSLTILPVELVDERLSTVMAAKNLRISGRNAKNSKQVIDMVAAISILEMAIEIERARS